MAKNLSVVLEGKGPTTLRDSNYVAAGGEGTVYKVSDQVVKIYHKPEEARRYGMPDKIRLLAGIRHPYICSPAGLVNDASGMPVGHYLPFVDGHPMARVFTNEFWQKERFGVPQASALVDRMREVYNTAHQHKAILVDANELNWFVLLGSEPEPRVIDVDSWAIGRWPASVIMPSIRDWSSKTFDEKTDWFAWGIVTFQIYTGLHPYKGVLDGFGRADLEGRMKCNASVFSKGVRLNRAVREFGNIPGPLLNWYEATFQQGERVLPPSPYDTGVTTPKAAKVLRVVTTGVSGKLVMEKLLGQVDDPVIRVFHCGAALLSSGAIIDLATKRQIVTCHALDCEVIRVQDGWVVANSHGSRGVMAVYVNDSNMKATALMYNLACRSLMAYENRLFAVTESGLTELKITMLGKPIASVGQSWGALVNSTKWFPGVGVMDAMGAKYLICPFGASAVAQVRVPELDGLQAVAAKAGNRFVSLTVVDKKGDYSKIEVTLDREYKSYKAWVGQTDSPDLNLTILPKGVCATIVRDGELDIFVPTTGQVNRVADKDIGTDMLLGNWLDKVIYIQDGAVWSLRVA